MTINKRTKMKSIRVPTTTNDTGNDSSDSYEQVSSFPIDSSASDEQNTVPSFTTSTSTSTSHKRSRDGPSERASSPQKPQKKRLEILKDRRQTVLSLYQQHAEQSKTSHKLLAKLSDLYQKHILPLEKSYHMHSFCLPTSSPVTHAELMAKPMVLLMGPYSTGKTTFICHLLGGLFPGVHIGPEPTTDKFMAICHGTKEEGVSPPDYEEPPSTDSQEHQDYFGQAADLKDARSRPELEGTVMKGNTLTVTPELPFANLDQFGSAFLNHFDGSICNSPLLKNLTLIDTPGVLSGKQQRENRTYDFTKAARFFADRCDLILLLFDAHKLDISDEFRSVVQHIRHPHNDDKIRCVLNKADQINREQLVRVYGSLLWSMGKLFETPEVVRVYTGSYWDEPLQHDDFAAMFESDEWLLIHELMNLPSVSAERKVNAMVKRIRLVKVHVCILGYLSSQMPSVWWGRAAAAAKRRHLLENLSQVFDTVVQLYKLSPGDMPNVKDFRKGLELYSDWTVFPTVKLTDKVDALTELISTEIPKIIKHSPSKTARGKTSSKVAQEQSLDNNAAATETLAKKKQTATGTTKMVMVGLAMLLACALSGLLVDFVLLPIVREEPLSPVVTKWLSFLPSGVLEQQQEKQTDPVKIDEKKPLDNRKPVVDKKKPLDNRKATEEQQPADAKEGDAVHEEL